MKLDNNEFAEQLLREIEQKMEWLRKSVERTRRDILELNKIQSQFRHSLNACEGIEIKVTRRPRGLPRKLIADVLHESGSLSRKEIRDSLRKRGYDLPHSTVRTALKSLFIDDLIFEHNDGTFSPRLAGQAEIELEETNRMPESVFLIEDALVDDSGFTIIQTNDLEEEETAEELEYS